LAIAARLQRKRAREKKHQNFRSGLRRMQRRGICFQRVKLCSLCWRRIQRARGKKAVILALRYFSAAAGDALRLVDNRRSIFVRSYACIIIMAIF
jgi:hypothetical protein